MDCSFFLFCDKGDLELYVMYLQYIFYIHTVIVEIQIDYTLLGPLPTLTKLPLLSPFSKHLKKAKIQI